MTQIERDMENFLFRIEIDQDVEIAMDSQISTIENLLEYPDENGFVLLEEEHPDCQIFPMPYHFRFVNRNVS